MVIRSNRNVGAKTSIKNDVTTSKRYVKAADEDEFDDIDFDEVADEESDGIMDAIDDVADNVEEIQDTIDDMEEDQVDIAINNNITDHFIAECERCGGIFISAVVDSDQVIDHVTGVCPLCGRETDQKLKWVIHDAEQ